MSEQKRLVVADDMVVTMEFVLRVDGEVIEDTAESEPIHFLQGTGQVLPGLEKELYGMGVGDSKTVELAPEDGYGPADEEAFDDMDRSEFPQEIPLQPGVELQLKDKDGQNHYARIESVEGDTVRLNYNHALAGKALHFKLRIVGIRSATEAEKDQGYAS